MFIMCWLSLQGGVVNLCLRDLLLSCFFRFFFNGRIYHDLFPFHVMENTIKSRCGEDTIRKSNISYSLRLGPNPGSQWENHHHYCHYLSSLLLVVEPILKLPRSQQTLQLASNNYCTISHSTSSTRHMNKNNSILPLMFGPKL